LSETTELEAAAAGLVGRARGGDAAALHQLLVASRATIYRWALVHAADEADAEDVTQEVLVRLHGSLHRFHGRSRFTTWLYRVTRNEAFNLRRRLHRRLRLADALAHEGGMEPEPPRDPLDRLHAARLTDEIESLLTDLPRRQRELFHLADLEGCPLVEAAERLGISAVTARVHLFHARRTLRARLLERWP
jgi:RNA polymerase sigma-70 factor, ECF subfamily